MNTIEEATINFNNQHIKEFLSKCCDSSITEFGEEEARCDKCGKTCGVNYK